MLLSLFANLNSTVLAILFSLLSSAVSFAASTCNSLCLQRAESMMITAEHPASMVSVTLSSPQSNLSSQRFYYCLHLQAARRAEEERAAVLVSRKFIISLISYDAPALAWKSFLAFGFNFFSTPYHHHQIYECRSWFESLSVNIRV